MKDIPPLDTALAFAHGAALDRLSVLMNRVRAADLTTDQIVALIVVLEAADRRVNGTPAPVFRLVPPT